MSSNVLNALSGFLKRKWPLTTLFQWEAFDATTIWQDSSNAYSSDRNAYKFCALSATMLKHSENARGNRES